MNMNYFSFYNKAKELLIDSLASLWFKGQAQEQEYIKRILTKDEPLFAEPVFQSIFLSSTYKCNFLGADNKQ